MHLDEIVASGLDTPDAWQGEVSFYNQRKQEVEWCDKHGVKVVAQSWSKLSGGFNWGSDEDYKVRGGKGSELPNAMSEGREEHSDDRIPHSSKTNYLCWSHHSLPSLIAIAHRRFLMGSRGNTG